MPIPVPYNNEPRKTFIERCLSHPVMNQEYKNRSQRYAICLLSWNKKYGK